MYNESFKEVREIKPLVIRDNIKHAYHLYVIIIKIEQLGVSRDTILNAILAENVGIGVHFRAIHYHPYYRKSINLQPGSLPNAEYISERVVSLPLYPGMAEDDVYSVIRAVKKVIFYYLRKK
jgi:dTDP-4-amino-4,6-dideoxygalactose transaminase